MKSIFKKSVIASVAWQSISLLAIAAFLSACSDYVDKIESDYKDQYGDKEKFIENMNTANWDWKDVCATDDWIWCSASPDGKIMGTATNGAKWESFTHGTVTLDFAGTDDNGYTVKTRKLDEADVTPYIRKNGGIDFKVQDGSGSFDAGIQLYVGPVSSYSQLEVVYLSPSQDIYVSLKSVDNDGNELVEWRWPLNSLKTEVGYAGVTRAVLDFKDLQFVHTSSMQSEGDLAQFIKNEANTVAFYASQNLPYLTLVGIRLTGAPFGTVTSSSSSSNVVTAKSSSSSNKGGTTTSSNSTEKVELAENAVTCEPEVSQIKVGESVKWKFTLSQEVLDAVPQEGLMAIHSVWAFEGADKSSSAKDSPSMVSYDIPYSTSGTKKATLDIKVGKFYGTFACSTLEVVEVGTASSSSSAKSSSSSAGVSVTCKGTPSADAIQWELSSYSGFTAFDLPSMKYDWKLPGGSPSTSTDAKAWSIYSSDGWYTAQVTVTAGGLSATATCEASMTVHGTLLSSSSTTSSGFLWDGSMKSDFVKTDRGSGSMWYIFTDADTDTGSTVVQVPEINPYDVCLGKCGMAWFGQAVGNNGRDPYAGVGFDLDESGAIFDVSHWNGLCIAYQSTKPIRVELRPYDSEYYGHNIPSVTLPATESEGEYRSEPIAWSDFVQRWSGGEELSGPEVATMLRGINIAFESDPYTSQFFNIYQIGSYGQCINEQATIVDLTQFSNPHEVSSSSNGGENPAVQCANDDLWCGPQGIYMVLTGLDAGDETSGYWFSYADDADGGQSKIDWPVERGNEYSPDAFDPVVDYCGGICGTYTLTKGTLEYDPYVGVGFSIAGTKDDSSEPVAADASGWGGVCITYTADNAAKLIMDLGDAKNAELASDKPFVTLGKTTVPQEKCFTWSEFKQGGWGVGKGGTTISGYEASKILVYLNFEIQAKTGTTGGFNVIRLRKNQEGINSSPFAWCGDLWCGPTDDVGRVNTGFDDYAGYWFNFSDANDGGKSYISFPADVEENEYGNFFGPLIETYKGIIGEVHLGEGYEYPYVGLGFNVYDEYGTGTNITDWGGVCLVYRSTIPFGIELVPTDQATLTEYNNYRVTVSKSATITAVDFPWSKFKQQTGWGRTVDQSTALADVSNIRLKFEGTAGTSGVAEIYSIGHSGTCSRPPDYSSSSTYIFASSSSSSESNPAWEYLNPAIEYGEFTDERDGQVYKTIDVGNYTWFAQNLNLEYNDGEGNSCPGSDPDSCAKYGRMYTWAAAMDTAGVYSTQALECGAGKVCWLIDPVQGVCPEGWHLPSNAEWRLLVEAAGGESTAAVALKSTKGWVWNSSNTSGTDDLGFSAIPNGPGEYGYFWSGTENSNISGYRLRLMGDATPSTHLGDGTKSTAMYAVRCVKEKDPKPRSGSFTYQGQTYNYVRIGTQTWMAENLNYDIGNNMCYENDPANCTAYGRMYKWATVVGKTEAECGYGNSCDLPSTGHVQGICPEGWHVPRRAEVETLVEAAGGDDFAGKALKATSTWSDYESNGKVYGNGTDATGFTGYSTGTCSGSSSEPYCNYDGMYTHMWTITENYSGEQAYYFGLLWMGNGVTLLNGDKRDYKNLRCVQDED